MADVTIMSRCHSCRPYEAGAAEECQSPNTAMRRAEFATRVANGLGSIGVAFSRSGDPMIGEFGDAQLLRKLATCPTRALGLRKLVPP